MGCCIVANKVLHNQTNVQFEVEEVGKKCARFDIVNHHMGGPFWV